RRPQPSFPTISEEDKAKIGELMRKYCNWSDDAQPMQQESIVAQVDAEDVILHAPTGSGKTAVVAGPYVFPENKGRVTIFVSPLIALQEEMVTTFKEEYKLEAVAVNSSRKASLKQTMRVSDICEGKYSVVLISPEMLQTRRFIDGVLRDDEFYHRVLALVIDEAHTISHWGAHFRKKYSSLGVVRAFLPPKTSVVAMSASFTPRVRRDVIKKLHFGSEYHDIDEGNNRPNVAIVVRACHRQLSSFADLDFVIPSDVQQPSDIPPTFIYCDKKDEGDLIVDHLRNKLPPDLRELGVVRPFNASLSHHYRKNALQHFRAGNIRIMVCTDAAGMGCNIPNIEVVVQWKLPEKLSMFVQRAGRAARRRGMKGLAVLLVEPSAYTELPQDTAATASTSAASTSTARAKSSKKTTTRKSRAPAGYAKAHGRSRGRNADATANAIDRSIRMAVDDLAEDEGLIVLVQTGDCRRRVLADVF
ncbi:P-loop containing nucleoside triphosphate hydrolase protein, partial [Exidia glandulosa HHB12029]